MEFGAGHLGGEFGCREELDASLFTGLGGAGTTLHGVVVGECQRRQPLAGGVGDEFLGGERPVGKPGVQMEVGGHGRILRSGRDEAVRRGCGPGCR
jgi:hypothetical protein